MKSCDWLPQTSGRLPSPVPENVPEPVPLKIEKVRTNISNIVNVNKC